MKKLLLVCGLVGLVAGGAMLAAGLMKVGENPAKLTWSDPEVKQALLSFAYKVYGNPQVENGRHYLSKIVFKNSGRHPVTDFAVSYKIDDYVPWTDPEVIQQIPPGFSFAALYYPKLPAQVSKLRNGTNVRFQMRFTWKEDGRPREESYSRDVLLRGANEVAYCDLPASEVESWFDLFNAAAFSMAMVTPNDPVVQLYTSEITKQAGGTTAGIAGGPAEVARLCRIAYDYMTASGLRYTGATGFPTQVGETATYVQNIRLPRDVIVNNQGLCIELTLLWCSLLEHMGVESAMVLIPGHAFVIAYSSQQGMPIEQGLPIECTAITPRAVGQETPVSFEDAVKMAAASVQKSMADGRIIILPTKQVQAMGFTPPELADVDIDKLGETLAKRIAPAPAATTPAVVVLNQAPPADGRTVPMPAPQSSLPPGYTAWAHPQGAVRVAFPAGYVSTLQPGQSAPFTLMSMVDPTTYTGCEVAQITGTQDPVQAFGFIQNYYAGMGLAVQAGGSQAMPNGAILFNGTTSSMAGVVQWMCVAKPAAGSVIFVSAGTPAQNWVMQSATIQSIITSVHFNP
ncbi:MAG: hypothetical protein IAE82_20790 [Opitutaceae bacterium]|nr:hypothetical protein [Opitutaceae bacterium]